MSTHALYRFFDGDDALLYVGRTVAPSRRWLEHARAATWWDDVAKVTRENFPSADDLDDAERDAIHDERPLHNIRLNYPRPAAKSPTPEPELPVRRLYGKATVASHLGISVRSLDRLIETSAIESVKIGRRCLIPRDALITYVESVRAA
jgi:excisionase family DNA binding protein